MLRFTENFPTSVGKLILEGNHTFCDEIFIQSDISRRWATHLSVITPTKILLFT